MGLLPENHAARIAWFQTRTALWTTNATAIGTTTSNVTDVVTKAAAAAAALAAQETAQNAAKSATQTLLDAIDALTNSGMTVVEQVRTKSRSAGEGVYPLADIPVPGTPAPRPAPGKPTDLTVSLQADGTVDLAWKCPNSGNSGTSYQVYRRNTPTGEYEALGVAGLREYVDSTIPAGSTQLTYKIRAFRTTGAGPWAEFNVNFGMGGSGAVVTAVEEASPKMAA